MSLLTAFQSILVLQFYPVVFSIKERKEAFIHPGLSYVLNRLFMLIPATPLAQQRDWGLPQVRLHCPSAETAPLPAECPHPG